LTAAAIPGARVHVLAGHGHVAVGLGIVESTFDPDGQGYMVVAGTQSGRFLASGQVEAECR
jgi:hypothetical protein